MGSAFGARVKGVLTLFALVGSELDTPHATDCA